MTIKEEVTNMALKNLFEMAKADKYTADGRETLIKAQEAETEDAKEKPEGSISPDGKRIKQGGKWVPRKNAKQPGAESKPTETAPSPSKEEKREIIAKQKFDSIKEGDEVTAYGSKVKIVKKYPHNNSVDVEFRDSKGEKQISHLSILDIDDDSFTKKGTESKPVEETKTETAAKFETEQENAKYEEGRKGWERVSKERLPDIKKKVEQKIDYYKKYDPYAMLGKRTGLNAAQKKAVEQNMAQAKENLAFYTGQLEGINKQMGASDSAPRVLTGDTRIRVRKA